MTPTRREMRIIIIDDDPIVCKSLQSIIELGSRRDKNEAIEVVATGSDGREAIDLYSEFSPDILLLDIRMEGMDGLTAGEHILAADEKAKILFLTTFVDEEYVLAALRMGAMGYLMKSDVDNILPALYAIQRGQYVFGGEIVDRLSPLVSDRQIPAEEREWRGLFTSLSEREKQLVKLVADGRNNKEIAEELHLSEGTVRNYLSNILDKLDLRDRTQLVVAYFRQDQSN